MAEDLALWLKAALECGFTEAYPLDVQKLVSRPDVRAACRQDLCGSYGRNWTCPPYCGTPEECEERMHGYAQGLLLLTVGQLRRAIDSKGYLRTEAEHLEHFRQFSARLRAQYPQALCLGAGGCRICPKCAWPEPCRFPEQACSSMEGYGLFVTQVCRDCGAAYYHGEKTVTYFACALF